MQELPTSNLAFWILIFLEAVSMKKIGYFLKTVKFWFFQKAILDLNKKFINHMQPYLSQVLSCTGKGMRFRGRDLIFTSFTIHYV